MYQLELKGSYYDMGYSQGKRIKEGSYLDYNFVSQLPNKDRIEFTDDCEKIIRRYTPEFLEELQGVADGSDIDYDIVRVWPISLYSEYVPSCSVLAVSGQYTINKRPIFIRNYDFLKRCQSDFTVFWTNPEDKVASIGFCDIFSSRYGGVNENGLAIAISSSPYHKKPKPGIVMNLATRWILDNYSSTKEAVSFLKKIPHFPEFNFLICDKMSNIARVEACPEHVAVVSYSEGFAISTNHYFNEEMKKFEAPVEIHYNSSIRRFNSANNWFERNKRNISIENAVTLAKNHDMGICDHFFDNKQEGSTLWSWIYEYNDKNLMISYGPPCTNKYQEFALKQTDS